jgi:N-acetylmuramoyl-L-alanine amidase
MKQIKKRRRILRIGNPIGFSLFCLVCLALLAGLYLGISWAIKNGPGVVKAMRTVVQEEVMTTPTVEPSQEPKDELLPTPTPTPEVKETPALGTPSAVTPSPEPTAYVSAGPAGNVTAPLYGQIIGIDPSRDAKSKHSSEAAYNLILADHVKRYLESQGATVVLSRTEETKGSLPNEERGRIFKQAECTYVIRLMCNHINSKTSACFARTSKENKAFGQTMIDAYVAATGMKRQNGKKNGMEVKTDSVASGCGCPCVLMVLGNWDNKKDRENLQDEVFMDRICEGIFNGLVAQITGEPLVTPTPAITDPPADTPAPTDVPAPTAAP